MSEETPLRRRALICGVPVRRCVPRTPASREGLRSLARRAMRKMSSFRNLHRLGVHGDVKLESMAVTDFRSVLQAVRKTMPDEIYNLAGQSSVSLSFQQPVETLESIGLGTLNLLEAVRFVDRPVRLYNAARAKVLAILAAWLRLKKHPSGQGARTPLPKLPRFGRSLTTVRHTACSRAREFCTTTSHRFARTRFVTRKVVSTAVRIAVAEAARRCISAISM